jgi:5-methylcytosine-specific restriction endonuclease McrA
MAPGSLQPKPPIAVVAPLSAEQYKIQLTGSRALSDKLREAQDLLAHQIPDRSLAAIIERALDLLLLETKKQRFGVGTRPRTAAPRPAAPRSRHIPGAIKREVFLRDGGQCTFVDDRGRRCSERGGLELDHVHGFARDPHHSVDGLRLRCRPHNQHAAEQPYGREGVERGRRRSERLRARARLARRADVPGGVAGPGAPRNSSEPTSRPEGTETV